MTCETFAVCGATTPPSATPSPGFDATARCQRCIPAIAISLVRNATAARGAHTVQRVPLAVADAAADKAKVRIEREAVIAEKGVFVQDASVVVHRLLWPLRPPVLEEHSIGTQLCAPAGRAGAASNRHKEYVIPVPCCVRVVERRVEYAPRSGPVWPFAAAGQSLNGGRPRAEGGDGASGRVGRVVAQRFMPLSILQHPDPLLPKQMPQPHIL
eukprot:2685700-Prymnesium_polylepis.3